MYDQFCYIFYNRYNRYNISNHINIISIHIPEPSIVPFISAPPPVRTWILGSYLKSLFVPFIFASFVFCGFELFLILHSYLVAIWIKRHMLKLVWIGQVWIVSQGPITPMGPSRSLEPTVGDVREIWGPIRSAKTCKKRAKTHKKAQQRANSISGTNRYPGFTRSCHFC